MLRNAVRHPARLLLPALLCVSALALATPAAAQVSFFNWTLEGSTAGSGEVVGETLHVVGPDFPAFCPGDSTWLETVAPVDGIVTVSAIFDNQDMGGCHYDAPVWVINDVVFQVWPGDDCWLDGTYEIVFAVEAGDRFGLGVWALDCDFGPGVADFVGFDFSAVTSGWRDLGFALDPRLGATFDGSETGSRFGQSVAGLDDLDGDGVPDVAVGAPFEGDSGVLHVLSGADGSELFQASGGSLGAQFGWSVADAGDVDDDGIGDVAVGAPFHSPDGLASAGMVAVYSGANGNEIFSVDGTTFAGFLGMAVAAVGDLDGDGFDDVLAGQVMNSLSTFAKTFVFRGPTGATLLTTTSPVLGNTRMGTSLAGIEDVTGDTVRDMVIGAPHSNGPLAGNPFIPGDVYIVSGFDGSIVHTITGNGAFGWSLAVVPDLDRDGLDDIAIGAPSGLDGGNQRVGRVSLHSSATGGELAAVVGGTIDGFFGTALAGGADFDDDGTLDLAVGTPNVAIDDVVGRVTLFTLPDLALTTSLRAGSDNLGTSLSRLADTNGDGLEELLVGGPAGGAGALGLVRHYDELDGIGPPRLSGTGPLTPNSALTLSLAKAQGSTPAWLVVGLVPVVAPFKGGTLVPRPDLVFGLFTGPAGTLSINSVWPDVQPPWLTVWLQVWMPAADGPAGWVASNAVRAGGHP